jgi:hypothetical protein
MLGITGPVTGPVFGGSGLAKVPPFAGWQTGQNNRPQRGAGYSQHQATSLRHYAQRHHDVAGEVVGPRLHQRPSQLQYVRSAVCL